MGGRRVSSELPMAESWLTGGHLACPGCGAALAIRLAGQVLGRRCMIAVPASCAGTVGASGLGTAWQIPFFHSLFECAPAVASGMRAGLDVQGIADATVVSWAGDAGTGDIGFQALSGAAERNEDLLAVCYDNELAMNTSGQADGSTPVASRSSVTPQGKRTVKKNLPRIMAAHGVPYVATASVAYPADFQAKLRKAVGIKGFRYLHVLAPCHVGWEIPPEQSVHVTRMATESGLFPLYEVEHGVRSQTVFPNRKVPVADYLRSQGRFRTATEAEIVELQHQVDARGVWRAGV